MGGQDQDAAEVGSAALMKPSHVTVSPAARTSCGRSRSRAHWAETGAGQAGNEQFCTATLTTYNARIKPSREAASA